MSARSLRLRSRIPSRTTRAQRPAARCFTQLPHRTHSGDAVQTPLTSPCSNFRTPPLTVETCRFYYTEQSPPGSPYPPAETAILSAALDRVPVYGFTDEALALGATDAGFLPASINLFPRGAFELVIYHLTKQRLALKDTVQFPQKETNTDKDPGFQPPLSTTSKIRSLLLARLHANVEVIHQLPSALALMSTPSNITTSLGELSRLSDEMWYLAGDKSVDTSWYTKRAGLATVYASSEMFMTQDTSKGFKDTEDFVDRRLEGIAQTGKAVGNVGQWLSFTASSTVNVLRSWGVRI